MIESINIRSYKSTRLFQIYDWLEGNLLLRSQGSTHKKYEGRIQTWGDIDLVFWGVKYIELPIDLRGVMITKPMDDKAIRYESKYASDKFIEAGMRTYLLQSEENRFYVIASNFWILENKTHVSESSLKYVTSYNEKIREDYFIKHVEKWKKVI